MRFHLNHFSSPDEKELLRSKPKQALELLRWDERWQEQSVVVQMIKWVQGKGRLPLKANWVGDVTQVWISAPPIFPV